MQHNTACYMLFTDNQSRENLVEKEKICIFAYIKHNVLWLRVIA